MASSVLGLPVLVTLQNGQKLRGTVANVDGAQQTLFLSDALIVLPNGLTQLAPSRQHSQVGNNDAVTVVNGTDIVDLEVASATAPVAVPAPAPGPTSAPVMSTPTILGVTAAASPPPIDNSTTSTEAVSAPSTSRTNSLPRAATFPRPPLSLMPSSLAPFTSVGSAIGPQPVAKPPAQPFVDPAILSFTRTPVITHSPTAKELPAVPAALDVRALHGTSVPAPPVSATLNAPFAGLVHDANSPSELHAKSTPLGAGSFLIQSPPSSPDISQQPPAAKSRRSRNAATTSTTTMPRDEPTSAAENAVDEQTTRRRRRRRPRQEKARTHDPKTQSGWATEDATDIQEMGDFDFVGNLSQFDKRSVFNQLRIDDTTAIEDRLVSFNKLQPQHLPTHSQPLPGTAGGRNLHYSENVLVSKDVSSSLSSDESDRAGQNVGGARSMRRDLSRISVKGSIPPSRKNSTPLGTSIDTLEMTPEGLRSGVRARSRSKYPASHLSSSHLSSTSLERKSRPRSRQGSSLHFVGSGRACPITSPANLERAAVLATTQLDITEDLQAEHAGRSIADVAFAAINPGGRRLATTNHNSSPVIVVLAANDRWGSRALAAARLLLGRGARVIVSTLGLPSDPNAPRAASFSSIAPTSSSPVSPHLPTANGTANVTSTPATSPYFTHQLRRLLACGCTPRSWTDTSAYLKTLDAPPELIIDALLGAHHTLTSITPLDTEVALPSMIAWANASKASVLSIDCPTGIDGRTGHVQVRHGEPVEVRARVVLCLAAPCEGLVAAMRFKRDEGETAWKVYVADIGVERAWPAVMSLGAVEGDESGESRVLKKRSGLSKGVRFGGEWIAEVRLEERGGGAGSVVGNGDDASLV